MYRTDDHPRAARRVGIRPALFVAGAVCFTVPDSAAGQGRWYVSMDVGPSLVPRASLFAEDNDWSTKCDLINNPAQVETTAGECATQPPPAMWENKVNGGTGALASLALGYRWRPLRIEAEYFHRTATYGDAAPVRIGDAITQAKADQELEAVESRIDGLIGHNLFANAYLEIAPGRAYVPYLGVGAGVAAISADYFNRWKRNDDPDLIATFDDPAMKARIAGTTTIGSRRKSDTVFAYQALAGIDRRLNDNATLGIKFRWTMLSEFADEDEYIQLRSHESSVGRGERIVYRLTAEDLSAFGATLNLRYVFSRGGATRSRRGR